MRARIAWIVAGIGAIGALVAWMMMRGDGTRDAATAHPDHGTESVTASGDDSSSGSTSGPHRNIPPPRVAPAPGDSPAGPGAPTLAQAESFDTEPRDDGWASATEQSLRTQLASLADGSHVKLTSIECRTRRCRIRIEAPDQNALGLALSNLGEPGGLYGVAAQMVISAPEPQGDGSVAIAVYGEFAR